MGHQQNQMYQNQGQQQQQWQQPQALHQQQSEQQNSNQQNKQNPVQQQNQQMENGEVIKLNNTQLKLKRTSKIDLKLFVGQIPKEWLENEVRNYFSKYGEILETQIIRDKQGFHKGCAFVKFASMSEAEKAVQQLSNNQYLGNSPNPVQIRWADGESDRLGVSPGQAPKLFIGSLPADCTEDNIRDIFEPFGYFEELHLMRDSEGRSKGCAFIRFLQNEAALIAIRNLNAQAYLGNSDKPIEVRFAEKKQHRLEHGQQSNFQQNKTHQQNGANSNSGNSNMSQQNTQNNFHNNEPKNFHTASNMEQPPNNPNADRYTKFYHAETETPYFYNWKTGESSYDEPPVGSIVFFPDHTKFYYQQPQGQTAQKTQPSTQFNNQQGDNLNDLSEDPNNRKPGPAGANLFIFHLPNDYKDSDLKKLFQQHGNVISARVMTKGDKKSRGYGFVSYDNPESAQLAINKLNGIQVGGMGGTKRLKVEVKKGEGNEDAAKKYVTSINQSNFNPF